MNARLFVSGVVAALLLVVPTIALPQGTTQSKTAAPSKQTFANRVEQRIKRLHEELKITAGEQPQWDAVAQAMREDAEKVGALIRERREKAATMNAVDDMRTYQAIAEAHAVALAKITSAFEALYEVMSPEQRKVADKLFARSMHRRPTRKKPK